jgi:hypothetical protein
MRNSFKIAIAVVIAVIVGFAIYGKVTEGYEAEFVHAYTTHYDANGLLQVTSQEELHAAHALYHAVQFYKAVERNDMDGCREECEAVVRWYSMDPVNPTERLVWLSKQQTLEKEGTKPFVAEAEKFIIRHDNLQVEQPPAPKYMTVQDQVAQDAVKEYWMVERYGDRREMVHKASMCAEAFLQAHDEENYRLWKNKERQLKGGY